MTDAGRRYKEVVGELTAVADRLREHDREQAAVLQRRLVELDIAMERAEERAAMTRLAAELRWEAVLEALWSEEWITLRAHPTPDRTADPELLDALDAEVERTAEATIEARSRIWPF